MSLRDKLLLWFKRQPMKWVAGVAVEKMVTKNTRNSGSYAARECRQLAQDGLLEREERPWLGKSLAYYRYNPSLDVEQMRLQDIKWFDSLPCCPLKCEGGERDSSVCKTLHPNK